MDIKGWKYYNHAAIPTSAPHENVDITPIENGDIWKLGGKGTTPLLARWTTDFDCGYETNWWYVIKDAPFEINALKAKRRYEVNKGIRNFDVRVIDPSDFKEELYQVQVAAFSGYPEKYRPTVKKDEFITSLDKWGNCTVFGAFFRETDELAGYTMITVTDTKWLGLSVQKTNPEFEKFGINAALVEKVVTYYADFLENGGIICDGSRSINHETNFQDYLEKYFGFRKAYCQLHIHYNPKIKWVVHTLFPLRKLLQKFDKSGIIHQLNAVLKMEEICRSKVPVLLLTTEGKSE